MLVCNSTFAVRFTFFQVLSTLSSLLGWIKLMFRSTILRKFIKGDKLNNYISKADGYQTSDLLLWRYFGDDKFSKRLWSENELAALLWIISTIATRRQTKAAASVKIPKNRLFKMFWLNNFLSLTCIRIGTKICSKLQQKPPFHSFLWIFFLGEDPPKPPSVKIP